MCFHRSLRRNNVSASIERIHFLFTFLGNAHFSWSNQVSSYIFLEYAFTWLYIWFLNKTGCRQAAFYLDSKVVCFAGSVPCWPQHIRQTKNPECATRNLPPRVLILLSFLSEVVFSVPVCIVEHMCDFCLYCIAHSWKDLFYIDLTRRITIHCIVSDVHKRMQMILSRNASRISCTESFFSCLPSIQPFVELPVYKERERASERDPCCHDCCQRRVHLSVFPS